MSKICLYVAVFICLFLGAGSAHATGDGFTDPEATFREGLKLQTTDLKQALVLFCEGARYGYGPSQLEVGKIYDKRPGKLQDDAQRRDMAAAMMWLDMAIINNMKEAIPLRKNLGMRAQAQDFRLYSAFTRMETNAPCLWEEIYMPVEEGMKP